MIPKTIAFAFFTTFLLAAEPEKLTKLRGSYESAVTKATAPIQKTYTTELEKLKIEFTKAGKLEDALAIDSELKRVAESVLPHPQAENGKLRLSKFKTVDDFFAWLATTTWESSKDNTLRFPRIDAVELEAPTGAKSSYTTTINKVGEITWKWTSGISETMKISPDLKSANGNVSGEFRRIEP